MSQDTPPKPDNKSETKVGAQDSAQDGALAEADPSHAIREDETLTCTDDEALIAQAIENLAKGAELSAAGDATTDDADAETGEDYVLEEDEETGLAVGSDADTDSADDAPEAEEIALSAEDIEGDFESDFDDGGPDEQAAGTASESDHLRMVEAILFASAEPISTRDLAERLPEGVDVKPLLEQLEAHYAERGVNLIKVAGRWQFRTASDLSFLMEKERTEQKKLSKAALETLSIIAYHQPVTRAEIEEIRGVSLSKGTLDVLMEVGWVKLRGRRQVPGRPVTYGTSDAFLEHFGLEKITDLPGLEELRGAGLLSNRLPPDFMIPSPAPDGEGSGDGDFSEEDPEAEAISEAMAQEQAERDAALAAEEDIAGTDETDTATKDPGTEDAGTENSDDSADPDDLPKAANG